MHSGCIIPAHMDKGILFGNTGIILFGNGINTIQMAKQYNLERYLRAQESDYSQALSEIKNGRKQSHWIWYIFPQIAGLGFSVISKFYAIEDLAEAGQYLEHPVLGKRLVEISRALAEVKEKRPTRFWEARTI